MAHKVVALKVTEKKGVFYISTLGQSPRGTKYILESFEAGPNTAGAPERRSKFAATIALLGLRDEPTA